MTGSERRQVIDIPPVRPVVTEHQLLTLACGCGAETKAQPSDGVTAPVQYGPRVVGAGVYLWHPVPVAGPCLPGAWRAVRLRPEESPSLSMAA